MSGDAVSRSYDFTQATIKTLRQRVGERCSNPECRVPTSGPHSNTTSSTTIGKACHICSGSKNGPRFNPDLSSKQLKHPENGIWLCGACHDRIDADPARYTAVLLKGWKEEAETYADDNLNHPKAGLGGRILDSSATESVSVTTVSSQVTDLGAGQTEIKAMLETLIDGQRSSGQGSLNFDNSTEQTQTDTSKFNREISQKLDVVKDLIDSGELMAAKATLTKLENSVEGREAELVRRTFYRIHANWGAVHQGLRDFESAAQSMIQAYGYNPEESVALVQRAYAEVLLDRPQVGESFISQALAQTPNDDKALFVASLIRSDDADYLETLWQQSGPDTPTLLTNLSFEKFRRNEFEAVRDKLAPLADLENLDARLQVTFAQSIMGVITQENPTGSPNPSYLPEQNEDVAAALAALERALKPPTNLPNEIKHQAYSVHTFLCGVQGDMRGAEGYTRKILAEDPEDPVALQNLLHIFLSQTRYAEALELISAHPTAFESFEQAVRHADLLIQTDSPQDAFDLLESLDVAEQSEGLASYSGLKGNALAALGRVEEGLAVIDAFIEFHGETPLILGFRAQLKRKEGFDAEDDYRRAVELSDDSYNFYQKRILANYLHNHKQKSAEAAALVRDLVVRDQLTEDTLAYLRYVAAANDAAEVNRVLTSLEGANVTLTDELLSMKAFILERQGRYQEALSIFQGLAERNPEWPIWIIVATCHYQLGEAHYPDVRRALAQMDPISFGSEETQKAITILRSCGYEREALDLTYKAMRVFSDEPQLQADFMVLFVNVPEVGDQPETVGVDTSVQFELGGVRQWLTILENPLPGAPEEVKPSHAWARALDGKKMGDTVTLPGSDGGEILVNTIITKEARAFLWVQETHGRNYPDRPAIVMMRVDENRLNPLATLRSLLEAGSSNELRALELYHQHFQMTMGAVGKVAGKPYFEACETVLLDPSVTADVAWHRDNEFDAAEAALDKGRVVLDLSVLVMLDALNMLEMLPDWFDSLLFSAQSLTQLRISLSETFLEDPEKANRLRRIVAFVEESCDVRPVAAAGQQTPEQNERTELLGLAPVSTSLLAEELGVPLYSEDFRFNEWSDVDAEGFGSPVLLAALLDRGTLSKERYHEAVAFFAGHNIRVGVPSAKTLTYFVESGQLEKVKEILEAITEPGFSERHATSVVAYAARDIALGLKGMVGANSLLRSYLDAGAKQPDGVRERVRSLVEALRGLFAFLPYNLGEASAVVSDWFERWQRLG